MAVQIIRDHVVLVTWLNSKGRLCFLGKEIGEGADQHHDAFYRPVSNDSPEPLELVMQPDLVEGMKKLRFALLGARRVIEAGREFALVLQKAAIAAGVEPDGFESYADKYQRALTHFEQRYGKGTPMNEDLTR
jgi:hypothetical protein